jgi:hypothetical protein
LPRACFLALPMPSKPLHLSLSAAHKCRTLPFYERGEIKNIYRVLLPRLPSHFVLIILALKWILNSYIRHCIIKHVAPREWHAKIDKSSGESSHFYISRCLALDKICNFCFIRCFKTPLLISEKLKDTRYKIQGSGQSGRTYKMYFLVYLRTVRFEPCIL